MNFAAGLSAAAVAVVLITFAVIRFGGLARRIGRRVVWLGVLRSLMSYLAAIIVFGGSELLPGWNEPITRGLASAVIGYALDPGLTRLVNLGPLTRAVDDIDREIRETNTWDDPWLLRRDARRLAQSYTPQSIVEIYEHNIAFVLKLDEETVRERNAILLQLLDETVEFDLQIGTLLRRVKSWGHEGWPRHQTVDGFILTLRSHGYHRLWANRLRRLVGRPPALIERASDVIA